VHQPQPDRCRSALLAVSLKNAAGVATDGGDLVVLEHLQPLKPVLVEDHRERDPGKDADRHKHRAKDEGRVLPDATEQEHPQGHGDLEEDADSGDAGRLLVGEVVVSHIREPEVGRWGPRDESRF